jgi:hypothetical protein
MATIASPARVSTPWFGPAERGFLFLALFVAATVGGLSFAVNDAVPSARSVYDELRTDPLGGATLPDGYTVHRVHTTGSDFPSRPLDVTVIFQRSGSGTYIAYSVHPNEVSARAVFTGHQVSDSMSARTQVEGEAARPKTKGLEGESFPDFHTVDWVQAAPPTFFTVYGPHGMGAESLALRGRVVVHGQAGASEPGGATGLAVASELLQIGLDRLEDL